MCEDHAQVSRREFLYGAAALGAVAAMRRSGGLAPRLPLNSLERAAGFAREDTVDAKLGKFRALLALPLAREGIKTLPVAGP